MTAVDPITGQDRRQLAELARRFPAGLVENTNGNDYVAHHVVNQRLLSVVGPFDFRLVQVLRGDLPAVAPDPSGRSRRAKDGTPALTGVVCGGVWRLVAEVDGRRVEVEEVGDCDPRNKDHDGERLKDAASDALKRCAMRLGLGLHLWAQEHYFLDQQLTAADEPAAAPQSKPGGANMPEDASPDTRPTAEPAKASDPSLGPVADGTPPDFDHLTSPGRARAWIRGQGEEFRAAVDTRAAEAGVALGDASLDDLRLLIRAAWGAQEAA